MWYNGLVLFNFIRLSKFLSTIYWKDYPFSFELPLLLCQRSVDYINGGVFPGYLLCSIDLFANTDTIYFFLSFFFFLGLLLQHMEVPRLGVESELQLPAYATATAMPNLSHVYDLHHSSGQHQILNPLTEARDQICILTESTLGP